MRELVSMAKVQLHRLHRGLMNKYRALPLHKIKYLAIVVDSEEAVDTFRIRNLLELFANMGIRNVILYDMDGVLKRSESSLKKGLDSASLSWMSLEVLSYADGKEALAKAASFICSKYLEDDDLLRETEALTLSESDISDALRRVGGDGPEPELLLVFAPVRCHLGFPAWRMRYTEIVHMGALKSLKPGALIKAIHDLSKKDQNYGS
ncbi:undecaprenyl pyrophosphate synthetase family protein isoform X2 [Wolffia australiana]